MSIPKDLEPAEYARRKEHEKSTQKAYRETHKEERAAYQKAYYEANKQQLYEHGRDRHSAYYRANLDKLRADHRAYHEAHREERMAYNKAYHAAHKGQTRSIRRSEWKTYYEANKDNIANVRAAYTKFYKACRKEEIRAYNKAYQKAHSELWHAGNRKRRAQMRGAQVGIVNYEAVRLRDKMICCICGKKVSQRDLSYDHTIPLKLGGAHTETNIRVAHRRCNSRKGARATLPVQMVLL